MRVAPPELHQPEAKVRAPPVQMRSSNSSCSKSSSVAAWTTLLPPRHERCPLFPLFLHETSHSHHTHPPDCALFSEKNEFLVFARALASVGAWRGLCAWTAPFCEAGIGQLFYFLIFFTGILFIFCITSSQYTFSSNVSATHGTDHGRLRVEILVGFSLFAGIFPLRSRLCLQHWLSEGETFLLHGTGGWIVGWLVGWWWASSWPILTIAHFRWCAQRNLEKPPQKKEKGL